MSEIKTDTPSVTNDVPESTTVDTTGIPSGLPEMTEPTMIRAWVPGQKPFCVFVLRSEFADETFSERIKIEAWLAERGYVMYESQDVTYGEMMGGYSTVELWSRPFTAEEMADPLPATSEPYMVRASRSEPDTVVVCRSSLARRSNADRVRVEDWLRARSATLAETHELGATPNVFAHTIMEVWKLPEAV